MRPTWGSPEFLVILVAAAYSLTSPAEELPAGLIVNEDDSHFVAGAGAGKMTVKGLHLFVDQFADTQVSQLFFCANNQRTMYKSKVWEAIWEGNEHRENRWYSNNLLLHNAGLNPFTVWFARCREKGISPWISMRMNDIHHAEDIEHPWHSTFWKTHPDYWIMPGTPCELNYAIKEVRDHFWSLIEEYFEMYDFDGIELDWLRASHNVPHGESCSYLTEFMRDIRALADKWEAKRGHPIMIAARIPALPEHGKEWGIEGAEWVKQGLVDILIPSPRSFIDFDIPMERWRKLIGEVPHEYSLAAGAEMHLRVDWDMGRWRPIEDVALIRGFAAAHLHREADQIYLFNFTYGGDQRVSLGRHQGDPFWDVLDQAGRLETCLGLPRRHPITTHDMKLRQSHLHEAYIPKELRIYLGPRPTTGEVLVRLGFADGANSEGVALDVRLNGERCARRGSLDEVKRFDPATSVVEYEAPLPSAREGYNIVNVTAPEDERRKIVWAEIYVVP